MRVCDICRIQSVESLTVEAVFTVKEYDRDQNTWVPRCDCELTCEKEICFECCNKLLKLFKKGGDSE